MHSTWIVALTLVIFGLFIQSGLPSKHNVVRGKKFLCETFAKDLVLNLTCDFRRLNRTYEVWSYEGFFNLTVDNLFARTTVFAQGTNLEYRPFMISNLTTDVCSYVSGKVASTLVDMIAPDLKRHSNFIRPCPQQGLFFLRNFTIQENHYPPILPAANIYFEFWYFMFIGGKRRDLYVLKPYMEVSTKGIVYY